MLHSTTWSEPVDLKINESEFDAKQNALVSQIVRTIHDVLDSDPGVDKKKVNEFTASIAFQVCSILDGSRSSEKTPTAGSVIPVLYFADNQHRRSAVGLDAKQSWMHEYVHGWVSELFDEPSDTIQWDSKPPCPHCGKPLRRPTATYCRFCKMDWADQNNIHRRG